MRFLILKWWAREQWWFTLSRSIPFVISFLCTSCTIYWFHLAFRATFFCLSFLWYTFYVKLILTAHFSISMERGDLWLPQLPVSDREVVSKEDEEGDRRWDVFTVADSPLFFSHCLFLDMFHTWVHPPISIHPFFQPSYYKCHPFSSPTFHWSPLLWPGFVFTSFTYNRAPHETFSAEEKSKTRARRAQEIVDYRYCSNLSRIPNMQLLLKSWLFAFLILFEHKWVINIFTYLTPNSHVHSTTYNLQNT